MLGKVAVAGGTVALTPWTAIRMPVGTEIPQPQPASVVTAFMGAEMPGGIDLTRPPVGRGHRIRTHRWQGRGMEGLVCTQRARGLVGQARKRLRCFGTGAPGFDRLGLAGPLWGHPALAGPGNLQHAKDP
jgi:hypothetical protein